jgi:predicted GNAT family acetyltransferase
MLEVVDNVEASQYEVLVDGKSVGFAAYRHSDDVVLLPHAEVHAEFNGQGIGSALARGALDDIRRQGLRAVPLCPFIVDYVQRHPEYDDMVAPLPKRKADN